MSIKQILEFIKQTIENNILALSAALKSHTYTVKLESNKVEVTNPFSMPDVVKVKETDRIDYRKDINDKHVALIKSIEKAREDLAGILKTLTPQKDVKVTNLKDIPKAPTSIKVTNPQKNVSITNFYEIQKDLGKILKAVSSLKLSPKIVVPDVIVPEINIPEIKQPTIKNEIILKELEKTISDDPKKYVPVRLTDGKKFYQALEEINQTISGGGARSYSFQDENGERTFGLVDDDQHVQVDVLTIDLESKKYGLNAIDDITTPEVKYFCKEDRDGHWRIDKMDKSTGISLWTYATINNNPSITTYTQAYTNRTTLTYGRYSQAF